MQPERRPRSPAFHKPPFPKTSTAAPTSISSSSASAANTLPCNSGSLSLYYIDGPAASLTPSAGPYPDGITATQQATFAGIFDANGT